VANIFVAASATWNGKALKKAKQDVSVFDKQVKKLGGTLAAAFSARAIVRFGKETVKAFAADEAAAKSLEIQLKNTGFAFSSPAVELYIANLQKTTGVLDDELRPAFQQLLTVTGSITTSQNALNTAMDVSAATGKSLSQVTTALSRAYAGNTTGLSRLGAGLDKALLKAGNMDDIMAELNKKFSGQALARLDTYAGKMSLFAASVANAEEIIGKGLLDALTELGDDKSIEGLSNNMEDFATATSEVIVGLGRVIGKLKAIGNIPGVDGSILRNLPYIGPALRAAEALRSTGQNPVDRGGQERTAGRVLAAQRRQEIKASQDLLKLKKQEVATLKAKTAVDELSAKFDVERIGFQKALNEATDSETKLRIRAQLAILDNNEALAKKILAEMEGKTAVEELTTQFYALSEAAKNLLLSFGVSPSQIGPGGVITGTAGRGRMGSLADVAINNPEFGYSNEARALGLALGFTPGISMGGASQEMRVTVDVSGAGDKLSQAIAESIQVATRNGYSTVPAGQGF
jgi:phage shock protein A